MAAVQQARMGTPPSMCSFVNDSSATLNSSRGSMQSPSKGRRREAERAAAAAAFGDISHKKLPSVEAERIIGVLKLSIQKLQLLSVIRPTNPELKEVLAKLPLGLREVANKHVEVTNASVVCGTSNPQAIAHSTRSLTRLFLKDAAAMKIIEAASQGQHCEEYTPLIEEMIKLQTVVFEKLLITVEEEQRRQEYLTNLMSREARYNAEARKLEDELDKEEDVFEEEIGRRDVVIARLLRDLEAINKASNDLAGKVERDAQKRETAEEETASSQGEEIAGQLTALEKEYVVLKKENREQEAGMRKRKVKLEAEVENWIAKYDMDMGEKQQEMDDIHVMYTEEKSQLAELQTRFDRLEVEYNEIMEERRQERARKEAAESELHRMVKAALLIQGFWRAYKCRKAMKKAQKKSEKKKKKK